MIFAFLASCIDNIYDLAGSHTINATYRLHYGRQSPRKYLRNSSWLF